MSRRYGIKYYNKLGDEMKQYTERLKELREDKDLTQQQIAEKLNCSQTAYGKWENGKREIKVIDIIKLALLYNVSTDYILGLTNNPKPNWESKEILHNNTINNSFNNNTGIIGDINIKQN